MDRMSESEVFRAADRGELTPAQATRALSICPNCRRPWREHGDVILRCPRTA